MKIVACLSGGMDSAVLLYHLLKEGHQVKALSLDYGQRHRRELTSAGKIAKIIEIEHKIIDLSNVKELLLGSALTDSLVKVPHGHYEEESMKQTVVPNRNMLFISLAASWALSSDCDAVALSVHSGDHAIYPDCRKPFIDAMQSALTVCDWKSVTLLAPFLSRNKSEICKLGTELMVPFEITWSCYEGGEVHCGCCGTCVERKEAFKLAGVSDPTTYLRE